MRGCACSSTDVEVLRLHYALYAQGMVRSHRRRADEIVALYDERFYPDVDLLSGGLVCGAFRNGGLVNYQLQFSRSRTALPITRDYMLETEAALRETAEAPERLSA
jgi:cyclopropane-fatty-acyl-phospholipid synthase